MSFDATTAQYPGPSRPADLGQQIQIILDTDLSPPCFRPLSTDDLGVLPGSGFFGHYRSVDQGATASLVSSSETKLYGLSVINLDGSTIFVKLYDDTESLDPTEVSPIYTFMVPANSQIVLRGKDGALTFANHCSIRVTTGSADSDVASPTTPPIIEIDF